MDYKYINDMLKRTDLQHLRSFLLDEMVMDVSERDNRTYKERLIQSRQPIIKRLEKIAKDETELDEIYEEYSKAEDTHTEVFFELGMKTGARLLFELLYQDGTKV